jgi:hypothetical protein
MSNFKDTFIEMNNTHPLVAGPVAGLMAVALAVLAAPSFGTERAWPLLLTVTAGASVGQLLRRRSQSSE